MLLTCVIMDLKEILYYKSLHLGLHADGVDLLLYSVVPRTLAITFAFVIVD